MKTASESRKMEVMVGSERGSYQHWGLGKDEEMKAGKWEKETASESRKMEVMVD